MKPSLLTICALLPLACSEGGASPGPGSASGVEACRENLRQVYAAMRAMNARSAWTPGHGGVALFAEIISSGHWPDDAEHRRRLTCPGGLEPEGPPLSFANIAAVTGDQSGYAGRDLQAYPLARFPTGGGEVLMACDNVGRMNHEGRMNVLFADGSVKTFDLAQEIAEGRLTVGAVLIPVGPSATDADLRKLTLN